MSDFVISGFCDEVCVDKKLEQQLAVAAAIGMKFVSLRFFDVGNGIKNILKATNAELDTILGLLEQYDLQVSSIGSPLGKVKLLDVEDETQNTFRDFGEYLRVEVTRACEIAKRLNTRLIRGFSFYHPGGQSPENHVAESASRLHRMAEVCDANGLTLGVEVEANLVGHSGELLARLAETVNHPALLLVFDGANLVSQGFSTEEIWHQWQLMKPWIGWLHVKDYNDPVLRSVESKLVVDEEALRGYVPVGWGLSGHQRIFDDLASILPALKTRLAARGIGTVYLELEPHLKRGGQFGGFSGADGFGIAHRTLCEMLRASGLTFRLREWPNIRR
jgi:sugar phosphate isomerase/epimerase